jgi:hypothetical protein
VSIPRSIDAASAGSPSAGELGPQRPVVGDRERAARELRRVIEIGTARGQEPRQRDRRLALRRGVARRMLRLDAGPEPGFVGAWPGVALERGRLADPAEDDLADRSRRRSIEQLRRRHRPT